MSEHNAAVLWSTQPHNVRSMIVMLLVWLQIAKNVSSDMAESVNKMQDGITQQLTKAEKVRCSCNPGSCCCYL